MPAALGVPLNTPADDNVRPVGSVPPDNREKVGAGDPEAANEKLYGEPTVPGLVGAPLVKAGTAGANTLNDTLCVAGPLAVVAVTTKLTAPASAIEGSPLRTPFVVLRVSHGGIEADGDHAVTVWLAANWCVYATLDVPFSGAALVINGVLEMTTLCVPVTGENALAWELLACTANV